MYEVAVWPWGTGAGAGMEGMEGREQPPCRSFFLLPGPLILISGRNSLERDIIGNHCVCSDSGCSHWFCNCAVDVFFKCPFSRKAKLMKLKRK